MPNRRGLVLALLLAAGLIQAGAADAVEMVRFSPAALAAARASGKPVLVEVSAPWCSVCRAQKPILAELYADPKYRDLVVFDVDFDSQRAELRALKVSQQSTLIAYKGGEETARSTGETGRAAIKGLVDKAF